VCVSFLLVGDPRAVSLCIAYYNSCCCCCYFISAFYLDRAWLLSSIHTAPWQCVNTNVPLLCMRINWIPDLHVLRLRPLKPASNCFPQLFTKF